MSFYMNNNSRNVPILLTYREGLEEDQALYDALHGVACETKRACQVATPPTHRCRRRQAGVHQGSAGQRAAAATSTSSNATATAASAADERWMNGFGGAHQPL